MPESVFATFDRAKARARQAGREIIDLSIGSSDVAPPEVALAALRNATYQPETYGYCLFSGTEPLRQAVSELDGAAFWLDTRPGHAGAAADRLARGVGEPAAGHD